MTSLIANEYTIINTAHNHYSTLSTLYTITGINALPLSPAITFARRDVHVHGWLCNSTHFGGFSNPKVVINVGRCYTPDNKPLLLRGARQVGKTWLMREFGHMHYALRPGLLKACSKRNCAAHPHVMEFNSIAASKRKQEIRLRANLRRC